MGHEGIGNRHPLIDEAPYRHQYLSRVHADHPFTLQVNGTLNRVSSDRGMSDRSINGNWKPARSCVVSGQLPDHRGAATVLPLLRRRTESRVPDRDPGRMFTLKQVATELWIASRACSCDVPMGHAQHPARRRDISTTHTGVT